jgi:phasin family protein
MTSQMQDFVTEQMQAFAGQAQQFGTDPLAAMREGVAYSADGLRSLEQPVRAAARSGVQLASLSHQTAQELIALQSQIVTATLGEMAAGFERAAQAKDLAALVSAQADVLRLSAERLVNDANRAMQIFAAAGRGLQQVGADTYEQVAKPAAEQVARATRARTSAKTARKAKAA